jgi:hypothetical protein
MVSWFLNLLYGAIPAQFQSQYSVSESVTRLASVVKPSIFQSFSGECVVGKVTETKVSIQRVIPFIGNSWKPFFIGSFEPLGTGSVLRGQFMFSIWTRVFMSVWFGFITFWTVLATTTVLTKSPSDLWFPLFGVGMIGAGIAMVLSGKWFARNDAAWLAQVISNALGTNVAQPGGQSDAAR